MYFIGYLGFLSFALEEYYQNKGDNKFIIAHIH